MTACRATGYLGVGLSLAAVASLWWWTIVPGFSNMVVFLAILPGALVSMTLDILTMGAP